ncbi:zinc-binding dehydrogenase [Furfurilactobacillus milii]|uniref:Zinc-binding dehydrogenase n=1 Tax=Furfurilactobacillus rossiae TaxID=231049 RepID=A0A7C9JBZ4_9LACO|nr:zinc-binding dehydrogenase [Furfurilactobacillus milii]MYV04353.1 zinc-binding dehydrogenase [Furfurilactobacillus milii]
MRAVVISEPGDSSVLKIEDRPIPKADATHTVINIKAFGIHRYEVLTRAGGSPSVKFPRVIGVEAVGEVFEPAANSKFTKGQRVLVINGGFGREFDGSYQEYALVPDELLFAVDDDVDWQTLAQYPENFYTAFGAMRMTKVQKSQSLLVRGGTTAVGMAMIGLAKSLGIEVSATTRKPERKQLLLDQGVDHVVIDQDNQLQTDKKFDGIVDMVGTVSCLDSIQHVNRGGVCCMIGLLAGEWIFKEFDPFTLGGAYLSVFDGGEPSQALFDEIFDLIKRNHLSIPISKTFKLADIAKAQDYVMANPQPGQVIVTTD